MNITDRPTDMLLRQLQANRNAARYRNPETGRRHFAHEPLFRQHFVREILAMRAELRARKKLATTPAAIDLPHEDDYDDNYTCPACGGSGEIMNCCDDLCHGQGYCMHGDMIDCATCNGTGKA